MGIWLWIIIGIIVVGGVFMLTRSGNKNKQEQAPQEPMASSKQEPQAPAESAESSEEENK